MKFMHLSDLHLGKRLNEFSLMEDQRYILDQILTLADREAVDGVWIAGDIYDKSVPSAEAVRLADDFLTGLAAQERKVFLISGNHDSPERLSYGARLVKSRGVYLSPVYDGVIEPVELEDEYGKLRIYLLPFLKPGMVRHLFPDETVESYEDAVRLAVDVICGRRPVPQAKYDAWKDGADGSIEGFCRQRERQAGIEEQMEEGFHIEKTNREGMYAEPQSIKKWEQEHETGTESGLSAWDPSCRNVLLAHQFVTGANRCDSEEVSVGGLDQVSAELFAEFDYTALGHIHSPQWAGRENVRYCGTPLKYSFSEASQVKSVTLVELKEKGSLEIRTQPLRPLRDLRQLKGSYMELTDRENYRGTAVTDYLQVILTDEEDIPDALGKLRSIYPNIMKLEYDNLRTSRSQTVEAAEDAAKKTPLELFEELYRLQNNREMSGEQREYMKTMIEKIWDSGVEA